VPAAKAEDQIRVMPKRIGHTVKTDQSSSDTQIKAALLGGRAQGDMRSSKRKRDQMEVPQENEEASSASIQIILSKPWVPSRTETRVSPVLSSGDVAGNWEKIPYERNRKCRAPFEGGGGADEERILKPSKGVPARGSVAAAGRADMNVSHAISSLGTKNRKKEGLGEAQSGSAEEKRG